MDIGGRPARTAAEERAGMQALRSSPSVAQQSASLATLPESTSYRTPSMPMKPPETLAHCSGVPRTENPWGAMGGIDSRLHAAGTGKTDPSLYSQFQGSASSFGVGNSFPGLQSHFMYGHPTLDVNAVQLQHHMSTPFPLSSALPISGLANSHGSSGTGFLPSSMHSSVPNGEVLSMATLTTRPSDQSIASGPAMSSGASNMASKSTNNLLGPSYQLEAGRHTFNPGSSLPNMGSSFIDIQMYGGPTGGQLPRPASMPALMGTPMDPSLAPQPVQKKKGRGGRTAAMDPRLDPSIDPKRAKRILANRQSAARSKSKQKGHLDGLEHAKNLLMTQKSELLREAAWLRSEVQSLEEDCTKLGSQLKALEEHVVFQEALQIKLLEQCGQTPSGLHSQQNPAGS